MVGGCFWCVGEIGDLLQVQVGVGLEWVLCGVVCLQFFWCWYQCGFVYVLGIFVYVEVVDWQDVWLVQVEYQYYFYGLVVDVMDWYQCGNDCIVVYY